MTIDTKSRHRTKAGGNVFLDLGFSPIEAKRLLARADAQIEGSIRLKRHGLTVEPGLDPDAARPSWQAR